EEVGHWAGQPEKETRLLQRNSGDRLFPNLERGNKYTIWLEGSLNNSGNGQTSEMTLTWERSNIVDTSEISFHFLEPLRSEDCDSYHSCLACLADQGCGWCSNTSTCHQRASGMDSQCGRGLHLVLSPGNCVQCSEYTDCHLCSTDPYCEWQVNVNRKGDFQCNRRGRSSSGIRSPASCSKPCHQQLTCQECLNNSSQCAWCQSTATCFLFTSYLAKYPSGECRDWYDSIHSVSQCMDCSRFLTCKDCLQNFECGWCGNSDNPTIGRCLAGDFSTLRGFENCSAGLVGLYNLSLSEPASWSYGVCPDIDECRLQMDNCHPFATCENTFESFECHCDRGYAGDGSSYCNKTCYNDCTHGWCTGPPDYSCTCDLGWTSDALAFNQTGVECDVDCGCNFHSTCLTGIGSCDQCQDWTMGERCELCRPGSHGNATGGDGCQQCACNGHGMSSMGDCNGTTGNCYCTEHTEGTHCQRCVAGYYGDPRDDGTCYHECVGRILLKNISSSALGSMRGSGISASGLAYCLWVLSTSDSLESCQAENICPVVSLTIRPDIRMKCGQNYVYVFDGIPEFLTDSQPDSAIYSDPRLIGAFCGNGRDQPITVEAVSGLLTVYFEGNISGAAGLPVEGFNATYAVNDCQPTCRASQLCQKGHCVCRPGYTGPDCASQLCPNNCSLHTHAGFCDSVTGLCVCADGFAGRDCGTPTHPGTIIWDTIADTELFADGGSPLLRLGHSMVEGPASTLWIFGGLSVRDGILSSVYKYSVPDRRWSQDLRTGSLGPSARYFHAAASMPSQAIMYVVGGLSDSGVVSDFWLLNLTSLEWRSEKSKMVPPVAGHTLTQCRNASLLLVGGYSPQNGFNNKLLEYSVASGKWSINQYTGTAPTGLYGHSAVYHQPTDALYVFGGYRFYLETVTASRELYSLYLPSLTWSLLAPSHGTKPLSRFFHVAGLFRDTMVVAGGRTEEEDFSADIVFYQLNCNTWIMPNKTGSSMLGEPMKGSVAHAGVTLRNKLYISAGYGGITLGSMVALSIPHDPCLVFTSPGACNSSRCVWCRSVRNGSCLSADEAERYGFESGSSLCDPMPKFSEDCRRLKTCSECLARHPKVMGQMQRLRCKWCTNCPEGACISTNASCTKENDCRINQREIFVASNCSEISCEASDCSKCTISGKCMWTRQFKRTGETRRILSVSPAYDWTCFSHSLRNVSPMPVESCPPEPCPTPCHNLATCTECLSSNGSDGGWQQCVWSLALQQCMSPSFLPMQCAAGMCGHLLKGVKASCNLSCASHNQCSRCVRHSHCGWCSTRGLNGIGRCLQGGLSGPQDGGTQTCQDSDGSWAFMSCPPENECLNGHHDCDDTQNCTDKLQGFECVCRNGYMQDNVAGLCKPVCEQGCVNGGDHCEKCKPLFVGSALAGGLCKPCSNYCNNNSHICIMREQNEKGRTDPERYPLEPAKITSWVLEGPVEESAVCVQCLNNSSGERCDTCLDGYFLLEGKCTKCQCNGHWDRCRSTDGTECQCQNNTETSCPTAQTDKKDCYKYQCARCKENFLGNPTNGRQCYRQITVEQEYCFDPTSQSNCYHEPNIKNLPLGRTVLFAVQPKFTNVDIRITIDVTFGGVDVYISNSHSSFTVAIGPASGVHTVRVGDPDSRQEPLNPELLRKRRALNVSVPLPEAQDVERVREERAEGLTTYITISSQHTILMVRGVRERLVITYPYELHTLKTQRFFMVLLGVGNGSGGGGAAGESQGLLFFRQDQAHIDLFVFFSVFFSCFFLFLSVCVLLWKMKQFVDFRREHRRHIQEMNKMASRPFAKLAVYFEPDTELVFLPLRHKLMPQLKPHPPEPHPHGRRSEPFLPQLIGYSYTGFKVGPITLEPTDDGMAGVATVMFQLPGGVMAPNRACLGSALVTLRHNLQEYCSSGHGASSVRKGGLSHDNLTSMSM
uniref:multiple epidermal growth factor-like domains protein 8 n=1 Tax=Pristiophorus japonicus TaxID=55135 RepID=UPI00398F5FCF